MDTDKHELKPSMFICVYPWFIEDIWNRCTSIGICKNTQLAARAKVRKREVSLQTIIEEGTKANDTFVTIVQTAKKLGVSAYDYIFDRVSNRFEMLSLAKMVREKSKLR